MTELSPEQKQKIQQALDAVKSKAYRDALNAIDGIRHPQVDRLRKKIVKAYRAQIAEQVSPTKEDEFIPSEPILLLDDIDQPKPLNDSSQPKKNKWWFRDLL